MFRKLVEEIKCQWYVQPFSKARLLEISKVCKVEQDILMKHRIRKSILSMLFHAAKNGETKLETFMRVDEDLTQELLNKGFSVTKEDSRLINAMTTISWS